MKKGIQNKINLVNDISGLAHDPDTINILKKTNIPFCNSSHTRQSYDNAK